MRQKMLLYISCFYLLLYSMLDAQAVVQTKKYSPSTRYYLERLLKDPTIPLAEIDTSKITDMSRLFQNSLRKDFTGIETWDVSNVKDMSYMFAGAKFFNQNIESWNVANVQFMSGMFYEARQFNQPLNGWDVSNVRFMFSMFLGAINFNQPLDSWNVKNVEAMGSMFYNARKFNQDISQWNLAKIKNTRDMFHNAKMFNQDLESWNLAKLHNKEKMFFRSGMRTIPSWYQEEWRKEQELERLKRHFH
ncbi:BspA family leucine-rich repeat surface protein [Helicobacter aurati]|uniref:BspA family leucine-rich repeat surface protein n=1 Tax=Helicobacter aurati TaxID=137778 RepID=A0A3D8J585_9HELI|nr:BspA family leucine-rich repeat surface protein [Helicobacter aurati]RDU72400.1 BspA family leucine-rich repeat surface protein [Helicobacter aurati]